MDRFGVFDVDGTLIRWQLYHAVVNRLAKAKLLTPNSRTQLKAALMDWKRRKSNDAFKSYENKIIELYERSLPNISTKVFDELVNEVIEEYQDQTYVYTRELIKQLKLKKYKLFIISGSHQELIERIANYYRFDDWIGSYYTRSGNNFTGEASIPSFDKANALSSLIKKHKVTMDESIAIGDTQSDASMLKMVDNPIAFNPDKNLFTTAKELGWKIVIERKNVIYQLEKRNEEYILV